MFETQKSRIILIQERLVSIVEHMQVPKWDRISYPEELVSSAGMPHPLQLSIEISHNWVKRSLPVTGSHIGVMSDQVQTLAFYQNPKCEKNLKRVFSPMGEVYSSWHLVLSLFSKFMFPDFWVLNIPRYFRFTYRLKYQRRYQRKIEVPRDVNLWFQVRWL